MPKFRVTGPDGQTVEINAENQQRAIAIAKGLSAVQGNAADAKALARNQRPGPPQSHPGRGEWNQLDRNTASTLHGVVTGVLGTADMAMQNMRGGAPSPVTFSGLAERVMDFQPQGTEEKGWNTFGSFLPGAAMPGSLAARTAAVALPTAGAEGSAAVVRGLGGDEGAQDVGRLVGGLAGGALAGLRPNNRPGPPPARGNMTPRSRGIRAATKGLTPSEMQQAAARLRGIGAEPTLVDVVGEQGRGTIRAAASRNTPARQQVQDFADARAQNLPDRMSAQARTIISPDPRTPGQIAADLGQARSAQAAEQFGAVRGEPVGTLGEVDHPYVKAAIREAARRERDPDVRAALTNMQPGDTVTVGMADRISRVLGSQAEAAARSGDMDLAATFRSLSSDIRQPTRDVVPAYGEALDNYAAQSRLMQAAEEGEAFLQPNTDGFVQSLGELGAEGLPLARAAARRAIERKSGENIGAAPGIARRLALAPEQQARNRALLGDADAERLQTAMKAEADLVENARFVAPRTGSQTQGRMQDAEAGIAGLVETGIDLKTGGAVGIVRKLLADMRNKGLSDSDAQLLAEAAIDPARLDAIIADIARRQPQIGQQLRAALPRAAMAGALAQPERREARPRPGPPR